MSEMKQIVKSNGKIQQPATLASTEQLRALQAKYATTITVRGTKTGK
jgi:hypothetical protein